MGYELAGRIIQVFLKQEMQKLKKKTPIPCFCVLIGMKETIKLRKGKKNTTKNRYVFLTPLTKKTKTRNKIKRNKKSEIKFGKGKKLI